MISRVKAAVSQLVGGAASSGGPGPRSGQEQRPKFPYSRPPFLHLSEEEAQRAADHSNRPIVVPGQGRRTLLPWDTGYAEVINAGKSALNEDQAAREVVFVARRRPMSSAADGKDEQSADKEREGIEFHYWALFDGHAGTGAAVMASRLLHLHICDQLRDIVGVLRDCDVPPPICLTSEAGTVSGEAAKGPPHQGDWEPPTDSEARFLLEKEISHEYLVIGAIENAFCQMGYLQPHLLGNEFTHLEFPRRIQHREIGRKMLFRDYSMTGWAYKTIEEDDLKFPLVYGEGKKARVMATIGVTRGLGDHDLKVHCSNIHIKPFLSCIPEVKVYDVTKYEHGVDDVLVLGTDGLWDVISDREVADAVTRVLSNCEPDNPSRFTLAAEDLVMRSRGILKERGWRLSNDRLGSGDDISVFVIPLYGHM
uniref:protein phosphatase 1H-like isoform X2 n=1 Tax=Pristiophorus japonicus TaxID=55135 RepID=UPI00398EAB5B